MGENQAKRLKPLLPTGSPSQGPPTRLQAHVDARSSSTINHPWFTPAGTAAKAAPKRPPVKIACEECRRKRSKCDGQRPRCGQCVRKGEDCVYVGEEGETMSDSLKRRIGFLEREKARYENFFKLLHTKPDGDALEILRRIRASKDPLAILDAIREAELLLPVDGSTDAAAGKENVARLDRSALESSVIQVPAQPWTTVAGDGLVSELVTNYFTWDGGYLFPSIDTEVFVNEMRTANPEKATWCSPLLVNAVCAQSSFTLTRAGIFGAMTGQNTTERFLDEAKMLQDQEQGRVSIPTVQALMLMYLTMTCLGRDRAGRTCRQIALDMVRRLQLESRYISNVVGATTTDGDRALISKALWGLFLLETRVAFFYFEPSQIPPPQIPNPFVVEEPEMGDELGNVDILGRPFETSPCGIPLVPGILGPACSLAELFYKIMVNNTKPEAVRGSTSEIYIQKRLYSQLRQLEESLPDRFLVKNNFTPSTSFLRLNLNETAFAIIQTIRHRTLFELPASQPGTTILELCLRHCQSDIDTIESSLQAWPFQTTHWRHLYLAMQSLVLLLDHPLGKNLFTRGCRAMRLGNRTFPICDYLLQATQAFAWATRQPIPEAAQGYLRDRRDGGGLDGPKGLDGPDGPDGIDGPVKDLHVSFALPQQDDARDLLNSRSGRRSSSIDVEEDIGALIEKWALY